jgi:acetolactate synthase-1/3 small subunit
MDEESVLARELMLIKVKGANRTSVMELVDVFRARVVDVGSDTVTIEATGAREKLAALVELLAPHGIKEIVQSGVVALARGNRGMTDRTARGLEK